MINILKKSCFIMVITVVITLLLSSLVYADNTILTVIVKNANIRASADVNSEKVGSAGINLILISNSKEGRWYNILLPNGKKGFVWDGAVTDISDKISVSDLKGKIHLNIKDNVANIRDMGDTSGKVIAKLKKGFNLNAVELDGEWYKIILPRFVDGKILNAFVHNSTVNVIDGEVKKTIEKTKKQEVEKKEIIEQKIEPVKSETSETSKTDTVILRVKLESVNIRSLADVKSKKVGSANLNLILISNSRIGRWYKVTLPSGISGYIREDMVNNISKKVTVSDIEGKMKLVINENVVNIREKNDKASRVIAKFKKGFKLYASELVGDWYKIILPRFVDNKLLKAYVYKSTVKVLEKTGRKVVIEKKEKSIEVEEKAKVKTEVIEKKTVEEEKEPELVEEPKKVEVQKSVVVESEPLIKKFFMTVSMGVFSPSSSDFKTIYKSTLMVPEVNIGYFFSQNFYVFGGFEFYKVEGKTPNWDFDIEMEQNIFSFGAGYNKDLSEKLEISGELGMVSISYSETLVQPDLENINSCLGFRLGAKLEYKISDMLGLYSKLGYSIVKDTTDDISANFGGIKFGIGLTLSLNKKRKIMPKPVVKNLQPVKEEIAKPIEKKG